jgi:hypothetical protein
MKKALKILLAILAVIILLVLAAIAYLQRPLSIDTGLIPNEFEYCGKSIWGSDPEYLEIVEWLKKNKDGWQLNLHTHYAGKGYYYPAFQVTIFKEFVAVSYKTDLGYPQYTKSFNHELRLSCENGS